MALSYVLRVPRDDAEQEFVLLNVSQKIKGSLDLKIEGTDGDSPFVGTTRQSRLSELLTQKNDAVSLSEWEAILFGKLLQREPLPQEPDSLANIEVVAKVSDNEITIVFRRKISSYLERIGVIPLKRDENHEIDTISWLSTAVARSTSLEQRVQELSKKLKTQEDAVEKLKVQLDQFQDIKQTDETALLDKFCETLNYKKEKVRDQQALLATARVDNAKAAQISTARAARARHEPVASRKQKRKSSQAGSTSGSDFEKMDVDKGSRLSDDELSRGSTSGKESADEMGFESAHDDSDDIAAGVAASSINEGPRSKGRQPDHATQGESVKGKGPVLDAVPPKRDLPFVKKGGMQKELTVQDMSAQKHIEDDSETSDDEL